MNWASNGCARHAVSISHLTVIITVEHKVLGFIRECIGSDYCMITSITFVEHLIPVAVVKHRLALFVGLIQLMMQPLAPHYCVINAMAG